MGEVSPNSPNRQAEEGWPLVAIRRPQQVMAEAAAAAPTCAGGAGGGDDATQGAVPHMQGGAYERQTLHTGRQAISQAGEYVRPGMFR